MAFVPPTTMMDFFQEKCRESGLPSAPFIILMRFRMSLASPSCMFRWWMPTTLGSSKSVNLRRLIRGSRQEEQAFCGNRTAQMTPLIQIMPLCSLISPMMRRVNPVNSSVTQGYVEMIPVVSRYWFGQDGILTIDTDYENNQGQERCWFITDDFRVRVSTVRMMNGVYLMTYCSERRWVTEADLTKMLEHNLSRV